MQNLCFLSRLSVGFVFGSSVLVSPARTYLFCSLHLDFCCAEVSSKRNVSFLALLFSLSFFLYWKLDGGLLCFSFYLFYSFTLR